MSAAPTTTAPIAPVLSFFIAKIAEAAGLAPSEVDPVSPLYIYGVDSRVLMMMIEEAETRFHLVADLDRISPAEPLTALVDALGPAL